MPVLEILRCPNSHFLTKHDGTYLYDLVFISSQDLISAFDTSKSPATKVDASSSAVWLGLLPPLCIVEFFVGLEVKLCKR